MHLQQKMCEGCGLKQPTYAGRAAETVVRQLRGGGREERRCSYISGRCARAIIRMIIVSVRVKSIRLVIPLRVITPLDPSRTGERPLHSTAMPFRPAAVIVVA